MVMSNGNHFNICDKEIAFFTEKKHMTSTQIYEFLEELTLSDRATNIYFDGDISGNEVAQLIMVIYFSLCS